MTEKNIFTYKLFLSLNNSDFNLFFCENFNPPPPLPLKKVTPLFPSNPPVNEVEVLSIPPPFLKIWFEAQALLLQKEGESGHYGPLMPVVTKGHTYVLK